MMKKELLKNYNDILFEISTSNDRDLTDIDFWDIVAAIFLSAFLTVAALGTGYVAYYIMISFTMVSTVTCMEYVNDNKSDVTKYIKDFLNSNFSKEIKEMSINSLKEMHGQIKNKLIQIFDNQPNNFEKIIKGIKKN